MLTTLSKSSTAHDSLPARMSLLFVASQHRVSGWIAEALAADGVCEVQIKETVGVTATIALLREQTFDVVLVGHEPELLNAIDLIDGLRGGGHDEPVVVIGNASAAEMQPAVFEVGGDAYCCLPQTTARSLLWNLSRAISAREQGRENRQLLENQRHRLEEEHREAARVLDEQRQLLGGLESLSDLTAAESSYPTMIAKQAETTDCDLPLQLVNQYRELLRAQVMLGGGNLSREMASLADLLAAAAVSAQRVIHMHLMALEELVRGLGNRSARHVMNRADLLILEVTAQLADCYRRRYHERLCPPQQMVLPGFDVADVSPEKVATPPLPAFESFHGETEVGSARRVA